MSFQWMRRIDAWIGKPLSWLFGLTVKPSRSLQGDVRPQAPPDRVICAKFIGLGSVVLSLPLLKALKEQGVTVAFWTFKTQADLVRATGLVDHVWEVRPTLREFIPSLWRTLRAARAFKAQAFLDLEPTANFSSLLGFLTGAPQRVGFMSSKPHREALFTHLVSLTSERHMVEHALWMGRLIGLRVGGLPVEGVFADLPKMPVLNSVQREILKKTAQTRIVLNVNAGDLSWHRMWTHQNWLSLSIELLKDSGTELVFVGAPNERTRVEDVISLFPQNEDTKNRVLNYAGKTTLAELLLVLKSADLVISVDSGIMHLAAWAGVPLVGLFGPETPSLYGPRSTFAQVVWAKLPCSPCLTVSADKITRCQDNQCMKQISPKQVLLASQLLLKTDRAA